jgi:hypothetical protein
VLISALANPRRLRSRRLVTGQEGRPPGGVHEIVLYVGPGPDGGHWSSVAPCTQAHAPFTHPAELGSPNSLVHTSGGVCAVPHGATHARAVTPRALVSETLTRPAAHVQAVLSVDMISEGQTAGVAAGGVTGVVGVVPVAGVAGGVTAGVTTGVVAPAGAISHLLPL